MSFVRPVSYRRFSDIERLLAPGSVLLHEHHLTPAQPPDSDADWRWRSNDPLRMCSDLTVVQYSEAERTDDEGERAGETSHIASIVAKNASDGIDSYPHELLLRTR